MKKRTARGLLSLFFAVMFFMTLAMGTVFAIETETEVFAQPETPVQTEESTQLEEPAATNKPIETEQPETAEETAVPEEPVASEKPDADEEMVTVYFFTTSEKPWKTLQTPKGKPMQEPQDVPKYEGYRFVHWYEIDKKFEGEISERFSFEDSICTTLRLKAYYEPISEATEEPAQTEELVATDNPVETEDTVEADNPAQTDEPVEMEEPVATDKPVETEDTVEADNPAQTDEPVEMEDAVETDEPVETADIIELDELGKTDEPIVMDELVETEDSIQMEEPVETEQPESIVEPFGRITDANGNILLTEEDLPEEAEKLFTIEDEEQPEKTIDIFYSFEGNFLNVGDKVTLYAILYGFEDDIFTLQWQQSEDGENWTDIQGETFNTYEFTLTEENLDLSWRMKVVVAPTEETPIVPAPETGTEEETAPIPEAMDAPTVPTPETEEETKPAPQASVEPSTESIPETTVEQTFKPTL
jgi:hypothetical protein